MDQACILAVEDYKPLGLPVTAEAIVLIELDGHPKAIEEEIEKVAFICREAGAHSVNVAGKRGGRKAVAGEKAGLTGNCEEETDESFRRCHRAKK